MQLHRGPTKDGYWLMWALVPLIALAIVAVMALAPGQVRAESEEEPDATPRVVCDGLGGLTMGVNTMTLKRNGEMTKSTQSSDGECVMSLTLIDVSSDTNPADKTKACTVTASPVRDGQTLDVDLSQSGDCATVAIEAAFDYGDSFAGAVPSQHPGLDPDESTESTDDDSGQGGVLGQSGCNYTTEGDDPHISSSRNAVSAHGWWTTPGVSWGCPRYADVTVTLRMWVCYVGTSNCWWKTLNTGKKRVLEGGGSGKRATARRTCATPSSLISFRSIIDVDLVGQRDPGDVVVKKKDLGCRPPGY